MANAAATGSAIDSWDKRWATDAGRADWLEPHPAVMALLPELRARGARTALDLGCGVGRHALLLAEAGFSVEAFDGSATGLDVLRRSAASRGFSIGFRHGNADALPYADGSFDFVLSWNVIYHGTLGDAGARIAEIWRVLKPGGLYQGTMLPTRNVNYGRGRRIAPETFVVDGPDAERGHPHCYCDVAVLVSLFSGFELLSLTQTEQRKPGSWHWNVVAERRPA
ncbi:MAG: class I SAM-dependent methyltransferase [Alphaproteobacteria bacterium]|nr:class I SAM-dependent methyltransferase [Alphaproteobacteria bacterium]